MTLMQFIAAGVLGLVAGIVGGLAGIGGSIVVLPGLALMFGYATPQHTEHHVYMAAAMCMNVLVAWPATRGHARAGALRRELVRPIMPAMVLAIVLGVLVSNHVSGEVLKELLVVFIVGYSAVSVVRAIRPLPEARRPAERLGPWQLPTIGAVAGFFGGFLGIGGGVVMVPMLQVMSNVRLRHAIAASAAVMTISAGIGAALKLATLASVSGQSAGWALVLALALAPGAIGGGAIGAYLAHRLPLRTVRLAVALLLVLAAVRMSRVGEVAWAWIRGQEHADQALGE